LIHRNAPFLLPALAAAYGQKVVNAGDGDRVLHFIGLIAAIALVLASSSPALKSSVAWTTSEIGS